MRRQLVPCLWARHSEGTGAEVRGGGADHEVAASGGLESLSAANWCNWPAEIGDIQRCQTMERLERGSFACILTNPIARIVCLQCFDAISRLISGRIIRMLRGSWWNKRDRQNSCWGVQRLPMLWIQKLTARRCRCRLNWFKRRLDVLPQRTNSDSSRSVRMLQVLQRRPNNDYSVQSDESLRRHWTNERRVVIKRDKKVRRDVI